MDALPDDIAATMKAAQDRPEKLRGVLAKFADVAPGGTAALPPLQQAQVQVANMQALLALGTVLHRLKGITDAEAEALHAEHTILAAYERKVQAAVAKVELGQARRLTAINIDAAHRFIEHAIPDLGAKAKLDLKQVAAATSENRDGVARASLLAKDSKPKNATVKASKGCKAAQRARKRQRSEGVAGAAYPSLAFLEELKEEAKMVKPG